MTRQEQIAITNLYSQVVLIRGNDCFDDDGNQVAITQSLVDEEVARLQAEQDVTQYKRDRQPEYPPVGDQLDAILKHLNYRRTQGEDLVKDLDNIVGAWLNVKSRYPKNGSN
ncbi:MAG: hypothetical protein HOI09_08740 [Porticoccaceae bacterium]|nr:hypothetical protein [Porticoccaceae bacterium]